MFSNYLKVAIRNLFKNRLHSFINIFGLALGMAVAILIALYVRNELSYDTWFEQPDDVSRVLTTVGDSRNRHQLKLSMNVRDG